MTSTGGDQASPDSYDHQDPELSLNPTNGIGGDNVSPVLLSLNCRSLPKHAPYIHCLLEDINPEAMFLTKTWLHADSTLDVALAIAEGYAILKNVRPQVEAVA